jgi:lysozyme family protein
MSTFSLFTRTGYWDKVKADKLPAGWISAIFDWAVNSGPSRAAKALQKAVMVSQDGAIGPKTLAAVSEYDADRNYRGVTKQRIEFYKGLSTFDTFGKGWLRRTKETRDFSLDMV